MSRASRSYWSQLFVFVLVLWVGFTLGASVARRAIRSRVRFVPFRVACDNETADKESQS